MADNDPNFFKVGMKMIFRLRDEPEQFRAGEIIDIVDINGIQRLKIEGIYDINENDEYERDTMIMLDIDKRSADITWAFPGYYTGNEISFVHIINEKGSK